MHNVQYARLNLVRDSRQADRGDRDRRFVDAAEVQSKALGLPEAPRIFVPHPIQDATDEEIRDKTDVIIDRVIAALTKN
jgi:hypothetical protein